MRAGGGSDVHCRWRDGRAAMAPALFSSRAGGWRLSATRIELRASEQYFARARASSLCTCSLLEQTSAEQECRHELRQAFETDGRNGSLRLFTASPQSYPELPHPVRYQDRIYALLNRLWIVEFRRSEAGALPEGRINLVWSLRERTRAGSLPSTPPCPPLGPPLVDPSDPACVALTMFKTPIVLPRISPEHPRLSQLIR
jgi:hypothetical protein